MKNNKILQDIMMKRVIRLTESGLRNVISESVRNVLNEIKFDYWVSSNDKAMQEAIEILAKGAIDSIIGDDYSYMKNATDLQECDYYDIQTFFSIENDEFYEVIKEPFSIKKFNKDYDFYSTGDIFEEYVSDYWEDVLPEDLVDAIYDRRRAASITHANCYGGGDFEVKRDLEIGTAKKVAEIIKQTIQSMPTDV